MQRKARCVSSPVGSWSHPSKQALSFCEAGFPPAIWNALSVVKRLGPVARN